MNAKSPKNPVFIVAVFIAVLALTSLACSFHPYRINPVRIDPIRISPISPTIEITLPQSLFDQASLNPDIHMDGTFMHMGGTFEHLLDKVTRLELHDGYIRFIGENEWVEGSYDLSLTAEDGALKAEVIAIDIPGLELGDKVVAEVNQELEEAFTDMVEDMNGEVVFQEVTVAEGGLRMKIQVNLDEITIPEMQIEFD